MSSKSAQKLITKWHSVQKSLPGNGITSKSSVHPEGSGPGAVVEGATVVVGPHGLSHIGAVPTHFGLSGSYVSPVANPS